MEVRIRETCENCLDRSGTLRVKPDLFGYIFGGISRDLKIREHIERIKDLSINLCVFLVGHEPGFVNGAFTEAQVIRIQYAIDLTREIYAQADLGVRKIYWRYINMTDAMPYLSVNRSTATDLTEAFSGPNDGIDVFWVQQVSDAGGWSNSSGPCNKDHKIGRTGAVVQVTGDTVMRGIILAHEVGHYLTLKHADTITNLMGFEPNNDGIGMLDSTSRDITASQRTQMRHSCWVLRAC